MEIRKVNVNNAQVSGKKPVEAEDKKNLAAKQPVFQGAEQIDNKYQGEKTDLLDANAFYNSLGISLSTHGKEVNTQQQISGMVGPAVMKRVAATPQKSVEDISAAANFAYDDILADDSTALFAMAGLKEPVNAPSLETMQETLDNAPFMQALFA